MSDANEELRLADLALEFLDPGAIGVDVDASTAPDIVIECLSILGAVVPEPDRVKLLITGDFVQSVQTRLFSEPTDDVYTLARGSGIVAAKTMPRADGTVEVVVPWWFFDAELDEEARADADPLLRHTVAHEAQHVAMRQNEGEYTPPSELSWKDQTLRSSAYSAIDEFRAELGAARTLGEATSPWSPPEVLEALSKGLAVAAAEYQEHLDIPRLVVEVSNAAVVAWRAMAYIAASEVHGSGSIEPYAAEDAWIQRAEPWWSRFFEIVAQFPIGSEPVSGDDLSASIEALADVLNDWLTGLGFAWTDERFTIQEWFFEDADFLEAIVDGAGVDDLSDPAN